MQVTHQHGIKAGLGVQGNGLLLQAMYGTRTAEAISATNTMNQIRLAELFATTIAEHAGIVAASAIYSFGGVSGACEREPLCFSHVSSRRA